MFTDIIAKRNLIGIDEFNKIIPSEIIAAIEKFEKNNKTLPDLPTAKKYHTDISKLYDDLMIERKGGESDSDTDEKTQAQPAAPAATTAKQSRVDPESLKHMVSDVGTATQIEVGKTPKVTPKVTPKGSAKTSEKGSEKGDSDSDNGKTGETGNTGEKQATGTQPVPTEEASPADATKDVKIPFSEIEKEYTEMLARIAKPDEKFLKHGDAKPVNIKDQVPTKIKDYDITYRDQSNFSTKQYIDYESAKKYMLY